MLYFIQQGSNGPIKIGVSSDPIFRMRQLQTGNPYRLRLLGIIEDPLAPEDEWHDAFRDDRLVGEWFLPSKKLLDNINAHLGSHYE